MNFKKLLPILFTMFLVVPSVSLASTTLDRDSLENEVVKKYGISKEFAQDLNDTDLSVFNSTVPISKTNTDEYFRIVTPVSNTYGSNNSIQSFTVSESHPIVTKISKEQAFKEVALSEQKDDTISTQSVNDADTVSTSWLRLETNITLYNENGQVSARYTWLKNAGYRGNDVIGIALSNNMAPLNNTASYVHKADIYNPSTLKWWEYTEPSANATNKYHSGGFTSSFSLFAPAFNYKNERGYLTFKVSPRNSNVWTKNAKYDAKGSYAHQSKTISGGIGISILLGGNLSVTPTDRFSNVDTFAQVTYK